MHHDSVFPAGLQDLQDKARAGPLVSDVYPFFGRGVAMAYLRDRDQQPARDIGECPDLYLVYIYSGNDGQYINKSAIVPSRKVPPYKRVPTSRLNGIANGTF